MAKKGSRLREFEKNHRVLDISGAQKERQEKKKEKNLQEMESSREKGAAAAAKKPEGRNWVRIIGLTVCVIFLIAAAVSVKNIFDLKSREADLQKKNDKLTKMKEDLTVELENVNSDEYIEEKARRELKLIRPNELVFYFPDNFKLEQGEKEKKEESKK